MRYSDQHMHCHCSFDSSAPLADMVRAAGRAGLSLVCFTDHMDMAAPETGRVQSAYYERRGAFAARRQEYRENPCEEVEVRFGMELGAPLQSVEEAALCAREELDFIIASVHNLPDVTDFYYYDYQSEEECRELNHRYLSELLKMAELDFFDVMGHIGYTQRYMARRGFHERITVERYGDELTALLRRLIERGKGIECNFSGLREGLDIFPGQDVLRLYRSLGGEILTIGGDCHRAEQVGQEIQRAFELVEACGFRYICEFRNRRSEFVKLA